MYWDGSVSVGRDPTCRLTSRRTLRLTIQFFRYSFFLRPYVQGTGPLVSLPRMRYGPIRDVTSSGTLCPNRNRTEPRRTPRGVGVPASRRPLDWVYRRVHGRGSTGVPGSGVITSVDQGLWEYSDRKR